jgi:hypothetical protein
MAAVKTNIWGIKVGDVVKFKSIHDCLVTIEIARVEEKSWYRTDRDMRAVTKKYNNKQKLSQIKKTKFIMTTFNIGDAVTFKPNIDSPEKDCVKGIVAEVLENGYYNVTVGLTSFWGSREVKLYGANLYSRV